MKPLYAAPNLETYDTPLTINQIKHSKNLKYTIHDHQICQNLTRTPRKAPAEFSPKYAPVGAQYMTIRRT